MKYGIKASERFIIVRIIQIVKVDLPSYHMTNQGGSTMMFS